MLGGDNSTVLFIVDQVARSVDGVAHEHPLEGLVVQLVTLMALNVDIVGATPDTLVLDVGLLLCN